jgi:hypothetical protein
MKRKGLGKNLGKGYKNIINQDPKVHSDSAKGLKQKSNMNQIPLPISDENAFHLKLEQLYPDVEILDIAEFMDEMYDNKLTDEINLRNFKEFISGEAETKWERKVHDELDEEDVKNKTKIVKTKTYTVYEDPAHAWMKVSKKELEELGIADKITGFSYQFGDYAYLEEDQDLTTFANAIEKQKGIKVEFDIKTTNKSSKVRTYPSYTYMTPKEKKYYDKIRELMIKKFPASSDVRRTKMADKRTLDYWKNRYFLKVDEK